MLSFFPRGVLDEILNLVESVSEGFRFYSYKTAGLQDSETQSGQEFNKASIAKNSAKSIKSLYSPETK